MGKLPNLNMNYENTHRVYYYLTFIYFAPGDTLALTNQISPSIWNNKTDELPL
jgi:hypothetical protein